MTKVQYDQGAVLFSHQLFSCPFCSCLINASHARGHISSAFIFPPLLQSLKVINHFLQPNYLRRRGPDSFFILKCLNVTSPRVIRADPRTCCEEQAHGDYLCEEPSLHHTGTRRRAESSQVITFHCCLPRGITSRDGAKLTKAYLTAGVSLYLHFSYQKDALKAHSSDGHRLSSSLNTISGSLHSFFLKPMFSLI